MRWQKLVDRRIALPAKNPAIDAQSCCGQSSWQAVRDFLTDESVEVRKAATHSVALWRDSEADQLGRLLTDGNGDPQLSFRRWRWEESVRRAIKPVFTLPRQIRF